MRKTLSLTSDLIQIVMFVPAALATITSIVSLVRSLQDKAISPLLLAIVAGSTIALILLLIFFLRNTTTRYRSGIVQYCSRYDIKANRKTWSSIKTHYRYVGVTGSTFKPFFLDWLDKQPNDDRRRYQFLLLHPSDTETFIEQELHASRFTRQTISQAELQRFQEKAANKAADTWTTVRDLQATDAYREGRMEIRFYSEYLNWWMQIVDGTFIYLGLWKKGSNGFEDPNLLLKYKDRKAHPTIADTFMDMWNRLWESGERVREGSGTDL
jgi:hypothetical protein